MRALVVERPGGPLDLRMSDHPIPRPGPGAVRVRVEACGLNPVDWKVAAGGPAEMPWPHVPGCDFVGIVDAVGPGVVSVAPGQRVAGHGAPAQDGALAEYVLADPLTVAEVPAGLDPVVAAALPCAAGTAYQSVVDKLRVTADDVVFVTAGGGAVGGHAVRIAAHLGARVVATASRRDHDRVLALGASEVIDHHAENVHARVLELTGGRGVDAVVDVLPAPSATRALRLLAFGGRIACVGDRAELDDFPAFTTAPSVHEIAFGAAHASGDERARRRLGSITAIVLEMAAEHRLDPVVATIVPLEQGAEALESVRRGTARGKVVVRI